MRLELTRDGRKVELARRCGGSLGVRGGADEVRVEAGRLQQVRRGGSAWAWEVACTLDLRQRKVLQLVQRGWWTVAPKRHRQVVTTDFSRGLRKVEWTAPRCASRRLFHGAYAPIPSVSVERAPAWNATTLHDRSCMLRLSESGFVLGGGHRGPRDAELQLWAIDVGGRVLLVRGLLRDDRFTAADRLHLWLGQRPSGYMESCVRAAPVDHFASAPLPAPTRFTAVRPVRRLAIRVAGVAVDAAIPGISARLRSHGQGLAFELRLDAERRRQALRFGLAVAFADGDGGPKAPRYLLSTARLDSRTGEGLGEVSEGHCAVQGGRLVARIPRTCSALLP